MRLVPTDDTLDGSLDCHGTVRYGTSDSDTLIKCDLYPCAAVEVGTG